MVVPQRLRDNGKSCSRLQGAKLGGFGAVTTRMVVPLRLRRNGESCSRLVGAELGGFGAAHNQSGCATSAGYSGWPARSLRLVTPTGTTGC
jgi:hypothetical protein